ncbi:MAG: CDC27 family protein [Bdellovibrionales bacterium]|nr:CDC27 family protein [Bdellovibrionales bacterium]
METEHLHQLIDEKNWTLILRELDQKISDASVFEDFEHAVWLFEKIENGFREKYAHNYYLVLWKFAFKIGKVKLAKSYAEFILNRLIEDKRVPAIRKLKNELIAEGLYKTHEKFNSIDVILGKKSAKLTDSSLCEYHPDMWKNSKNILKNYLVDSDDFRLDHWKLAYEYILKFYFDKDLFLLLAEKAKLMKKSEHKIAFLNYLAGKKVNLKAFETVIEENKLQASTPVTKKDDLHVDYDELAMDVMSGATEPSLNEQKRIIVSIEQLSKAELLEKGKDMVVAFGLLGMDKVVVRLSEKILPLLKDVKDRASLLFMMAQALYNNSEFYKVIDVVEDILTKEPLVDDEALAFHYLKAESLLKLKKIKMAKELFLLIKKQNPHYRLVGERLRYIEEIK